MRVPGSVDSDARLRGWQVRFRIGGSDARRNWAMCRVPEEWCK
jgi:hypothetical protein